MQEILLCSADAINLASPGTYGEITHVERGPASRWSVWEIPYRSNASATRAARVERGRPPARRLESSGHLARLRDSSRPPATRPVTAPATPATRCRPARRTVREPFRYPLKPLASPFAHGRNLKGGGVSPPPCSQAATAGANAPAPRPHSVRFPSAICPRCSGRAAETQLVPTRYRAGCNGR